MRIFELLAIKASKQGREPTCVSEKASRAKYHEPESQCCSSVDFQRRNNSRPKQPRNNIAATLILVACPTLQLFPIATQNNNTRNQPPHRKHTPSVFANNDCSQQQLARGMEANASANFLVDSIESRRMRGACRERSTEQSAQTEA